jgi:hypothetical protein
MWLLHHVFVTNSLYVATLCTALILHAVVSKTMNLPELPARYFPTLSWKTLIAGVHKIIVLNQNYTTVPSLTLHYRVTYTWTRTKVPHIYISRYFRDEQKCYNIKRGMKHYSSLMKVHHVTFFYKKRDCVHYFKWQKTTRKCNKSVSCSLLVSPINVNYALIIMYSSYYAISKCTKV